MTLNTRQPPTYLKSKGVDIESILGPLPDSPKTTATAGAPEALRAIEGLEHLTLNELVQRFGPVSAFKEWLRARKTSADVRRIELQNAQTRSEPVSRELVEKLVLGRIDGAFKRISPTPPSASLSSWTKR